MLFRWLRRLKKGPITKQDIKATLKKHSRSLNILEAGASIGSDTIEFARDFPHATIYAFEPVQKTYSILKGATKEYSNISIFQLALSDTNGSDEIFISDDKSSASSSSLLEPREMSRYHPQITFPEKETVQTRTIDLWAKEHGVEKIDIMWLDMQGMEQRVLAASPLILSTVQVLYTEVSLKQMYDGTLLYPEYRAWLEGQGFVVVKEELPWEDMGNVLFVRIK